MSVEDQWELREKHDLMWARAADLFPGMMCFYFIDRLDQYGICAISSLSRPCLIVSVKATARRGYHAIRFFEDGVLRVMSLESNRVFWLCKR